MTANNLETFSNSVIEKYGKERKISEFVTCRAFDKSVMRDSSDFVQVGIRQQIPEDTFLDADKLISYDIATNIAFGERNYIIYKLSDMYRGKSLNNINNYEEIKNIVKPTGNKTLFAFMGLKNINLIGDQKGIISWYHDHPLFKRGDFLILSGELAKIIWVSDEIIDNKIIVFSKEDVEVIQKQVKDMPDIEGIPDHKSYSKNEDYLDVLIARSMKNPRNLDIYVKSILKLNILDKNNIFIIKVNK